MIVSARFIIVLTAVAVAGSSTRNQRMDIVKDGQAAAVIVVQKAPESINESRVKRSPMKRTRGFECDDPAAAKVLADWIEKIADVRLEVADRPSAERPAIYIGAAAIIKAGLDLGNIDSPTKEGLRIISDGKTEILIGGQNATSTMRAVCRFLEELGCR